jgi:hypothetical protein
MVCPAWIFCAIFCFAGPFLRTAGDPKEIVRNASQIDAHNRELARSYTQVERDEERTLDSAGAVKHREIQDLGCYPAARLSVPPFDPARR